MTNEEQFARRTRRVAVIRAGSLDSLETSGSANHLPFTFEARHWTRRSANAPTAITEEHGRRRAVVRDT